jgi:hypothetical protein
MAASRVSLFAILQCRDDHQRDAEASTVFRSLQLVPTADGTGNENRNASSAGRWPQGVCLPSPSGYSGSMTAVARIPSRLPSGIGAAAAAGFYVAAVLRRTKPIHSRGVLRPVRLRRWGTGRRWGAAWLDEPGTDVGTVRLSRALGLPGLLPDILGLALRIFDGVAVHDLLLATTGRGRPGRFLLLPRRDAGRSSYTSLLPYRAPHGLVVLAAVPAAREPAADPAQRLSFRLLAAPLTGAWEEFGALEAAGPLPGDDPTLAFDPVVHPLPGLAIPPVLARIRQPAYAAARRARDTAEATAGGRRW